jgi:hypothetical protein
MLGALCSSAPADAHAAVPRHVSHPVRVVVFGDSTAVSLAWGMASKPLTSRYGYRLRNLGMIGCGIANGPGVRFGGKYYLDHSECNGAPVPRKEPLKKRPWPIQWKAALSKEHPNVAVVLAGRWEVVDRAYDGVWTNILDPVFASYVKQQLELASDLIASAGANVVFMTSPCVHEANAPNGVPYPESDPRRLAVYNELVRQVVAEHPTTDSLFDLGALVCRGGKFQSTYDGVTIRTRDGIHFTPQAGSVLGPVIMPTIVASGRAQMARIRASSRSR